eukprot:3668399-Rhodomonas_salina.3
MPRQELTCGPVCGADDAEPRAGGDDRGPEGPLRAAGLRPFMLAAPPFVPAMLTLMAAGGAWDGRGDGRESGGAGRRGGGGWGGEAGCQRSAEHLEAAAGQVRARYALDKSELWAAAAMPAN